MPKRQIVSQKEKILKELLSGKAKPQYEGKEVVIFDGKVYILPDDGKEAAKLIEQLEEKKPGEIPTITFVPRKGPFILTLLDRQGFLDLFKVTFWQKKSIFEI